MSRLRWYGPLLAAIGGILCGAFGDNPIGWAILAGAVVLFVLGNPGKRILGVLIVLVSLLAGWLALNLDPIAPVGVAGALLGLVGGALVITTAGSWSSSRSRFERGGEAVSADAAPLEVWKAMDEGHDPTDQPDPPEVESDDRPEQAR